MTLRVPWPHLIMSCYQDPSYTCYCQILSWCFPSVLKVLLMVQDAAQRPSTWDTRRVPRPRRAPQRRQAPLPTVLPLPRLSHRSCGKGHRQGSWADNSESEVKVRRELLEEHTCHAGELRGIATKYDVPKSQDQEMKYLVKDEEESLSNGECRSTNSKLVSKKVKRQTVQGQMAQEFWLFQLTLIAH